MDKGFYVALENRFRGSEELVKERQKKYLKFIKPLKDIKDNVNALDIGCGRGEWLSLLKDNGFLVRGIDIDRDMVELCAKKGFNVKNNDALSELKNLEDNSVDIISAFQVVEHIDFDDVLDICKEAMRVLSPCGILILETPNPENIMVSTQWFYLDATHKKPIPCELLSFVTEYYGFCRNFILKLNEKDSILYKYNISLYDVFEAVSADYAIIAQKDGDRKNIFDNYFIHTEGASLAQISRSYTDTIRLYNENSEYARMCMILKDELVSIKNSKSWKITKPLRLAIAVIKKTIFLLKKYIAYFINLRKNKFKTKGNYINLTIKELEIYNKLKKD